MSEQKKYLCIHGHFYQPPRENPWTEKIELQESARPYHDWNERIWQECYLPNCMARVLDSHGRIADIVNNYEQISFNFGPTLLSWLAVEQPETYQKILEADRKSMALRGGHGNAIAQVYNHMIMPLANRRDKVTQVRWGIQEFRERFQREPESIWLPETACNEETLEVLVELGMKYLILEPHQAESIRNLDGSKERKGTWHNVSQGQIDPKNVYRCYLKKDPEKFIDIFFYDGPLSKDLGFGDLLFDAKLLMDRIDAVAGQHQGKGLLHAATDGETYGHHKAFGERALAYALNVEAPKREYHLTNYGQFLENNPPQYEVRLKEGDKGEGTSWSCAHGVKRWKEHCGCRGDGPASWTQHWRKPLRQSLDWLRDELIKIYERDAPHYFKDIWEARNEYVRVTLNRTPENIRSFMQQHGNFEWGPEDQSRALKLMEMQRHAMLMYTSCGWFFTEISGIETVQILQYAARAIELAYETSSASFEMEFLNRLADAKSNVTQYDDGKGVYEKLVKPRAVSWGDVVAYYAILISFNQEIAEQSLFYGFYLKVSHQRQETFGDLMLSYGKITLRSSITWEEKEYAFIAAKMGPYDVRCSVKPFQELAEPEKFEKTLFEELYSLHLVEILRKIDDFFGEKYFSIRHLPFEQRKLITASLRDAIIEKIRTDHEVLFDQTRKMSEIYRSINLPIPAEMKFIAEFTLTRRLKDSIMDSAESGFNPKKTVSVTRILKDAAAFEVSPDTTEIVEFLNEELRGRIRKLEETMTLQAIQECLNIHKLSLKIGVTLDRREVQDRLFFLVKKWIGQDQKIPDPILQHAADFLQLLRDFSVNPNGLPEMMEKTQAR